MDRCTHQAQDPLFGLLSKLKNQNTTLMTGADAYTKNTWASALANTQCEVLVSCPDLRQRTCMHALSKLM